MTQSGRRQHAFPVEEYGSAYSLSDRTIYVHYLDGHLQEHHVREHTPDQEKAMWERFKE